MFTIEIQPSFQEIIKDVKDNVISEDRFWINFYDSSDALENGLATEEIIKVSKDPITTELKFDNEKVNLTENSNGSFLLQYKGQLFNVKTPKEYIQTSPENFTITAIDINTDKTQFALGTESGDIILYNSITRKSFIIPSAHLNDVTKVKYFPSGAVLLSIGLDYQIKIWDTTSKIITGELNQEDLEITPARIFQGHKRQISSMTMIERGRNFLTGAEDGIVKLWDCSSGKCIYDFQRCNSVRDSVTDITTFKGKPTSAEDQNKGFVRVSESEFGTENTFAFIGYDSGTVVSLDLHTKSEMKLFPNPCISNASVCKVVMVGEYLFVGYSDGTIAKWDIESNDDMKPITKIKLNGEIKDISSCGNGDIFISYGSGFVVALDSQTLTKITVLDGGIDTDGLFLKSLENGEIFVGNKLGFFTGFKNK